MKKIFGILVMILGLPVCVNAAAKNPEGELVSQEVSYIKTTTINGMSSHEEMTEEEYNNIDVTSASSGARNYVETSYKRLTITVYKPAAFYFVQLELVWKVIPATRSFDIIAFRTDGMEVVDGSQYGAQIYTANGQETIINYAYNGTNIRRLDDGFGISMNVVNNSNLTALSMYIDCNMRKTTTGTARIYGTYQHAIEDITLGQSHNYEISAGGLGNVLHFFDGYENYYDCMNGVYATINE